MNLFSILGAVLLAQQAVAIDQVDISQPAAEPDVVEQLSRPGDAQVTEPIDARRPAADEELQQLTQPDTEVEFARVEGMDRCSAELLSAEDAEYCAQRLETRSSEFATSSEAPLTAEQILIGERFASTVGAGVTGASRNASRRDISPDDADYQALAAVTLAPAPDGAAAPEDAGTELPPETQALVEAIVNQLGQPRGDR